MADNIAKRGIELVLKGYSQYINDLKTITKSHAKAYDTDPLKQWQKETKKQQQQAKAVAASSKDLATRTREANRANQEFINVLRGGNPTWEKLKTRIGGVKDRLGDFRKRAGDSISSIKNLGGANNVLVKTFGAMAAKASIALFALKKLYDFKQYMSAATDLAVRNETIGVTFELVAKRAGFTTKQAYAARDALKAQGITTKEATTQLQRMAQANLDWAKAGELARVAQDTAVISGRNSSESFARLTTAIQRGSAELLDELGIIIRFSKTYEDFARANNRAAASLTEQEKLQIRMNAVLEEGKNVAGSYEAALDTAGKMQGSMARLSEETALSLGNIILPIKTLIVEFQYKFAKGLAVAAKGLESFKAVTQILVDIFKKSVMPTFSVFFGVIGNIAKSMISAAAGFSPIFKVLDLFLGALSTTSREGETFMEKIGRAAHSMARGFVVAIAFMKSTIQALRKEIEDVLGPAIIAVIRFIQGDFAGAGEMFKQMGSEIGSFASDMKDSVKTNMTGAMKEYKEQFPDLFKSWDELTAKTEFEGEKVTAEIDRQIAKVKELQEQLKAQEKAIEGVRKIWENYNESVADAGKQLAEAMAEIDKDFVKAFEEAGDKRDEALDKLNQKGTKDRQKLIDKANEKERKRDKSHKDKLLAMQRAFNLARLQASRRFTLSETRLRAEGDVLALMELRENFKLQETEARENHALAKENVGKAGKEQAKEASDALKTQLKEFDSRLDKRRQAIRDSYDEEIATLNDRYIEQQKQAEANYDKQLADLKVARDKQLREYGESLQEQTLITEEGMANIAEAIGEIFGDQGAADQLMAGWADRSRDSIEQATDDMKGSMEALNQDLLDLEKQREEIIDRNIKGTLNQIPKARGRPGIDTNPGRPGGNIIGARTGAVGVVTGPATFQVEPGVQEAVMFSPLGNDRSGSSMDVNFGGNIQGQGFDNASTGAVDAALELMVMEMQEAIKRSRRSNV